MKTITLELPDELDDALNTHLDLLKDSGGYNHTKAQLIIKLMRIGLLKESRELLNEERAEK